MSRILLVEDEEHLAEGLAFNLRNSGYDVDIAPTGEDALEHTLKLLMQFEDQQTAYISRPRPQFLSYDGPFDHLARVKEWQTVSDTE